MRTRQRSAWHRGALVAALVVVGGVGAGCRDSESDAKQAGKVLNEGLQAHVEGRLDEAGKDYEKVLSLDPANKFAYYNLGLIAHNNNRPADAEAHYRDAISLDPNYVPALFNLAILRTAQGDVREAIELYRRAVVVQPDYADAHLNLGFALKDVGQTAEGDAELAKAAELNPGLAPQTTSTTVVVAPGVVPTAPARRKP